MTLSMPVLPDCTRCGAAVVLVIDGDGAREECVGCGLSQKPMPPKVNRAEIRKAVRESRVRRMLGPSCLGRLHTRCTATGCECTCHDATREARKSVLLRHCRLRPDGLAPVYCAPSKAELEGRAPRRQGAGTDGKPIYDSREAAEAAAQELEALGAWPMRAYRCNRSRTRGHLHLTTDTVALRKREAPDAPA